MNIWRENMSNNSFVISEESIEVNKAKIIEMLNSTGRRGIDSLIKWLCESDFFTAPASTKYHLSCRGGLALHSINVYKLLKGKVDSGLLSLSDDTVIITSFYMIFVRLIFMSNRSVIERLMESGRKLLNGELMTLFQWVTERSPVIWFNAV